MSHDPDKLDHIEFLRGFAALIVLAVHSRLIFWIGLKQYWATYGTTPSLDGLLAYASLPFAWGSFGVPLFFVISGYVIHRRAALKLRQDSVDAFSAISFWRRRFFKIYPTLLAALLLTVALDTLSNSMIPPWHHLRGASENHAWTTFIGNLLTLQGIAVSTLGSNGALWTLALEIQFYALYPLLLAARQRLGLPAVAAGVALINALSYVLCERAGITVFASYYLSWCLGAWLAERDAQPSPTTWHRGAVAAVGTLAFAAGCGILGRSSYGAFQLWSISAAALLWLSARWSFDGGWLRRVIRKVGEFSYSLYVIHVPVLTVFAVWLYGYEPQDSIVPAAVMVLVCIPFGWTLYRLIEKPSTRLGQRRPPAQST